MPPSARSNHPGFVATRSDEAAALLSEQLGIDEAGRDGAAVHSDHRRAGAARAFVQGPREHFLAASSLANDEHREVCRRHLLDLIHHGAKARFYSDNGVGDIVSSKFPQEYLFVRFQRFAQALQLVDARGIRQRDANRLHQTAQKHAMWRAEVSHARQHEHDPRGSVVHVDRGSQTRAAKVLRHDGRQKAVRAWHGPVNNGRVAAPREQGSHRGATALRAGQREVPGGRVGIDQPPLFRGPRG